MSCKVERTAVYRPGFCCLPAVVLVFGYANLPRETGTIRCQIRGSLRYILRTWYPTCNRLLRVWYRVVTITESTLEIYRKTANHGTVVRPTPQPSHGPIIKTVVSETYHIPPPWSIGYRTGSHLRRLPRVQGGVSRGGGLA